MASFDEIVTDRRLSVTSCLAHLGSPELLEGKYRITRTGGTGMTTTLIALTVAELERQNAAFARFIHRWRAQSPDGCDAMTLASITTSAPAFRAQHIAALFDGFRTVSIPITLPWSEILETLNRSQPDVLSLYPSLLPRLARQAVDGSLDIAPKLIVGGAEPLSKRHREVAARAWSCPVLNMWGAAETGLLAIGEGVDSGMLLREGEAIIEPVDCAGRPVADGRCADKVYVTPLFRRTLPLLRYELTDRILVRPQRCTTAPAFRWIDDIRGRLEDDFVYRGARVSADAFQGPLGAHPEILEYQVRQTRRGARILVTAENSLDTRRLASAIQGQIQPLLAFPAEVSVSQVESIERTGAAHKLRNFVPIPSS